MRKEKGFFSFIAHKFFFVITSVLFIANEPFALWHFYYYFRCPTPLYYHHVSELLSKVGFDTIVTNNYYA